MTATNVQTEPTADTGNWRDWSPGLDNGERTLQSVFDGMPSANADEIDQMVRLLENPASPYTVPSISRLRHNDCIRILLGRGLLNQDEAFVLGYAMGTARDHLDEEPVQLFRHAARLLNKTPYRMTDNDLTAFDLAFEFGNRSEYRNICGFDFDGAMELNTGDVRDMLDIDVKALKAVFRKNACCFPATKPASAFW